MMKPSLDLPRNEYMGNFVDLKKLNKHKALVVNRNGLRSDSLRAVKALSPWATGEASIISGGKRTAETKLANIQPGRYAKTRNHLKGAVSELSPYIRHGVISINKVRNLALSRGRSSECEKFIQQLAWRDYWQRLYRANPSIIWEDAEDYKTGFSSDDYADVLPDDIRRGETGVAAIDHFIKTLTDDGTLHNHARLYLAGYICHWRRVKWQAGARWFLEHLLDGDPGSNNLSWQWVASTFSNKPYYYNLENVDKFTGSDVNTRPQDNEVLAGTYKELYARLFPKLEPK